MAILFCEYMMMDPFATDPQWSLPIQKRPVFMKNYESFDCQEKLCKKWRTTKNEENLSFGKSLFFEGTSAKFKVLFFQTGAAQASKCKGSKGSKTPLKMRIFGFYYIFMWQFLELRGAIAALAPLVARPLLFGPHNSFCVAVKNVLRTYRRSCCSSRPCRGRVVRLEIWDS